MHSHYCGRSRREASLPRSHRHVSSGLNGIIGTPDIESSEHRR